MLDRLKVLFKERQAETGANVTAPERRQIPRARARAGLRVLIVDDSNTVLAVLGRMLQQDNYTVIQAHSGQEALDTAFEQSPELVLLDIVMPGMSGFAVLRALRRDPRTRNVPVIMISGNLQATEQFYGQRIGADDFIRKPFGRRDVFLRIQHLVEIGRLQPREADIGDQDDILEMPELEAGDVVDDFTGPNQDTDPARMAAPPKPDRAHESTGHSAGLTPRN